MWSLVREAVINQEDDMMTAKEWDMLFGESDDEEFDGF